QGPAGAATASAAATAAGATCTGAATLMRMSGSVRCAAALSMLLLAACATTPAPQAPAEPAVDTAALVAAVRAAAGPADVKDELAIQPLRDPMVEGLRQQAT